MREGNGVLSQEVRPLDQYEKAVVGKVSSVAFAAREVVFDSMEKAMAFKAEGDQQSFEYYQQRTTGVFAVMKIYEAVHPAGVGQVDVIDTCRKMIFACMEQSRFMASAGEVMNSALFREQALGAFNLFDRCTGNDEKKVHRVSLLNEIFPVGGSDD